MINYLLLTWTDVWLFLGKAFQSTFKFLPPLGFAVNFIVWIIVSIAFFYWLYKQAKDTKKAQAEGRLI
ncbi:MAG: hypothetical protein ACK452_08335 [Bacteroidota bacterium]|jgi:membrane protein implicated in regulation of membrane protease activity